MVERFISEPLRPVEAGADTTAMAGGGPGLPKAFTWRAETVQVARLLRTWRETGHCRHGSGERYVRKHWFEVVTTDRRVMRLYFERQARRGRITARWWLFAIRDPDA